MPHKKTIIIRVSRKLILQALFLLPLLIVQAQHSDHKNVLLILCDDMGAMELNCYGHPYNQTPALNRLADEGVRFKTFFATPVCSPTRVCLMTGKFGNKTGWLNMRGSSPGAVSRDTDLSTSEYTIGQMFQDAGYDTYMAGKWQLTGKLPTMITECGFDEYLAWIYQGDLEDRTEFVGGLYEGKSSRFWQPGLAKNGVHFATSVSDYGPDMFSDFLIESIEKSVNRDKPFFAYYPMVLMHTPWIATPDHPEIKGKNTDEAKKANVEYTDKIVGKLITALDRLKIRKNTLVVFIGDNGTQKWGKSSVTEWGIRTPCIFSCPETVMKNYVSEELVQLADILTTVLSYSDFQPDNIQELDGMDLIPHLRTGAELDRDYIWSFYGQYRIIREKEWLLESNSADDFGDLFYCGNKRDGLGYEYITDFSPQTVKDAISRFNNHVEELYVPDFELSEKLEFEEFVSKKRNTMIENVTELYGYPYNEQTVSVQQKETFIFSSSNFDIHLEANPLLSNAVFHLTDVLGKNICSKKISNGSISLSTMNMTPGCYFFTIEYNNHFESHKLLITNNIN